MIYANDNDAWNAYCAACLRARLAAIARRRAGR